MLLLLLLLLLCGVAMGSMWIVNVGAMVYGMFRLLVTEIQKTKEKIKCDGWNKSC
jgi:hypothetical protein